MKSNLTFRDRANLLCDGEQSAFESAFKELEEAVEKKSASYILGKIYKRCVELYNAAADWAKNYIFRPLERLIKNRLQRNTRQNRAEAKKRDEACPTFKNALNRIIYTNDTTHQPEGIHQFYICRMIKDNGKVVYQKIGTTYRDTTLRMYEHLQKHWDKGVRRIVVDRTYEAPDKNSAELIESFIRAKYGRLFKEDYIRLDRFSNPVINLDELDKDVANLQAGF